MAELTRDEFGKIYGAKFRYTIRFLSMKTGLSDPEAEELAQAAWARAWEYRHQLLNPEVLVAWVNSIAKNIYNNRLRRLAGQEICELSHDTVCPKGMERALENLILYQQLLQHLDAESRDMLVAHYEFGYSDKEISDRTGLHRTTIRVRRMRERRILQSYL